MFKPYSPHWFSTVIWLLCESKWTALCTTETLMWPERSQFLTVRLGLSGKKQESPLCSDVNYYSSSACKPFVGTFSSSEHGRGQFTLLGLYVAESEPAREAVGHHWHYMVRARQVSGGSCGLQDRQPGHDSGKKTKHIISSLLHIKTEQLICPPSRTFHEGKEMKVQCLLYSIDQSFYCTPQLRWPQVMYTENNYEFKNNVWCTVTAAVILCAV